MATGFVNDWDDMKRIWLSILYTELKINPEDQAVLLTEAPTAPPSDRLKAAEIFFEYFRAPAINISTNAKLALQASGYTSGVVLQSGQAVTFAVPIIDGVVQNDAVSRLDLGGQDVSLFSKTLLADERISFNKSAGSDVIDEMKQKVCYVAADYEAEMKKKNEAMSYTLPDGKTVSVNQTRFRAPELLFQPALDGKQMDGIQDIIFNSITKCKEETRNQLYEHVIMVSDLFARWFFRPDLTFV